MLAGWLEESDENRAYFRECLARRELPASAKAEREWARFAARNKILFAVPEVAGRRRSRFLRYVAAAAVVAAGVCAVWFWQRTPDVASEAGAGAEISAAQPLEYRTACGERLDIVLPDGSKVCMNSEATLTVDPGFGKALDRVRRRGVFHHFARQKLSVHHPQRQQQLYGAGNVVQPAILRPGEFRRGDAPYGVFAGAGPEGRHHPRPPRHGDRLLDRSLGPVVHPRAVRLEEVARVRTFRLKRCACDSISCALAA